MLRHMYADYLMATGRLEESVEQVRLGRSYDPLSRLANMVLLFHTLATRRYDETIVEARRALQEFPDARWAHARIAEALWYQGRHEEALPEQKLALGDDPLQRFDRRAEVALRIHASGARSDNRRSRNGRRASAPSSARTAPA